MYVSVTIQIATYNDTPNQYAELTLLLCDNIQTGSVTKRLVPHLELLG